MKTLNERIESALDRIKNGDACMRIPADPTDPDLVLVACQEHIAELEAELQETRRHLDLALPKAASACVVEAGLKAQLEAAEALLKKAHWAYTLPGDVHDAIAAYFAKKEKEGKDGQA